MCLRVPIICTRCCLGLCSSCTPYFHTACQVRRSLSRLVSGASSADNVPLAAFDADGTLWDGDAAEEFMDWMKDTNRWSHHGDFVGR